MAAAAAAGRAQPHAASGCAASPCPHAPPHTPLTPHHCIHTPCTGQLALHIFILHNLPQVERLLCGVDAAVYLLDYTKLKTQEEVGGGGYLCAMAPGAHIVCAYVCACLYVHKNVGVGGLDPFRTPSNLPKRSASPSLLNPQAAMLGRLRSLNPELVRRLCTRLFFAVNKFDQADTGSGLGADETREYVARVSGDRQGAPED